MPLSLIGAGLGRTGTLSVKRALERLGHGPCFHAVDLGRSAVFPVLRALNRDPIDWERVYKGYVAAVDWPAYAGYRALSELYPAAKVILTVRDPNSWFDSALAIHRAIEGVVLWKDAVDFRAKMAAGVFGESLAPVIQLRDRDSAIAGFEQHNAEVRATIPADRLLVFDVKQGWAPLCEFLGVPIPDEPFPHANSRMEFPTLLNRHVRSA